MEQDNDLIILVTNKEITRLYKSFLELLEDLRFSNEEMLKKLSNQYGDELIEQLNYFTPEKYEHLRKRILDVGNETNRTISNVLGYYDFDINPEKLQKALNQRKTVKKFTTSSPMFVEYNKD